MNKKLKIIIEFIIAFYLFFCITDCFRLKGAKFDTKPLITISMNYDKDKTIYNGLGYSITYLHPTEIQVRNNKTYINHTGEGAIFKFLFITLWSGMLD